MDYGSLSSEDFDAIVTGELTHYAIWMESVLVDVISAYFAKPDGRKDFERLLLRRDGLRFQDKIEIVRAMQPLFGEKPGADKLPGLLRRVEDFKANRNAFAHGVDVTPLNRTGELHVEVVSRSGKEKVVVVTPESHSQLMSEAELLPEELQSARDAICA